MQKVICVICLFLISGCVQTLPSSSSDWPEKWDYVETAYGNDLSDEDIEQWLADEKKKDQADELAWKQDLQRRSKLPDSETPNYINNPNLTELEKLHQWVQDSLASGAVHSVNVVSNEVRMDPISWSLSLVESKRTIILCFSRYFDLQGSTGRVTIRSKYSDEKLATYGAWGGVRIYK
jgi:hypothetical protein